MNLIVTVFIAFTVFAGEIVFSVVLKQEDYCTLNGSELAKAVSPLLVVSAALWGPRCLLGCDDPLHSLAVCFGVYLIFFLIEFFAVKKRVPALHNAIFFVQSALACVLLFDISGADGIVKTSVLFGAAALIPTLANFSVAALKTKVNSQKCGTFISCCACLTAPVIVCAAFAAIINEVIVSVQAL